MLGEPSMERKAAMGIARQALAVALHTCSFRWLFCLQDGKDESGDCACGMGWGEDPAMAIRCQCPCHARIRELEAVFQGALRMIDESHESWWWNRGVDGAERKADGY